MSWCVSFKKCWLISSNSNEPIIWSCDKYKAASSLWTIRAAAALPDDKWRQFSPWSYLLVSASPPYLVRKAQGAFIFVMAAAISHICKVRKKKKSLALGLESKYPNWTIAWHPFSPFSNWVQNRELEKQFFFSFWLFKQIVAKTTGGTGRHRKALGL